MVSGPVQKHHLQIRFWPCTVSLLSTLAKTHTFPPVFFLNPFKKCREQPICGSLICDGTEQTWHPTQTAIVGKDINLCCPWITRWPLVSSVLRRSYQTTLTKEPIRPEFRFVAKKGLVLSQRSLFVPISQSKVVQEGIVRLADGSWSYYGNSPNPSFYHLSLYYWPIKWYLLTQALEGPAATLSLSN